MPAAAALVGTALTVHSANKASDAQDAAVSKAGRIQKNQQAQTRADLAPYREAGNAALFRLSDVFNLGARPAPVMPNRNDFYRSEQIQTPAPPQRGPNATDPGIDSQRFIPGAQTRSVFDESGYNTALQNYQSQLRDFNSRPTGESVFQKSPGYAFRLSEGNKAIDRLMSARRITGGRAFKEAERYAQDYASNEFGNYVNQMMGIAGMGQGATNVGVNVGQNNANQMSQLRLAQGENQANTYANMNNAVQSGLNNYMTYRAYSDLNGKLPPTPTPQAMPSRTPMWAGG